MTASRSLAACLFASAFSMSVLAAGCSNGPSCERACPSGVSMCCATAEGTGACATILTDRLNCGGCGIECAGSCVMGSCSGTPLPDAGPRDTPGSMTDTPATGPCTGTRTCGDVTVSCTGFTGGVNADGRGDPSFNHCGICGRACNAMSASRCATVGGGSGTPECLCGAFRCLGGEQCVSDGGVFACVNTQTDEDNCGSIGNACADGEMCTAGMCGCGGTGAACSTGESCCGGACIPTVTDAANCGGCGVTCGAGETCAASACSCGGDVCAAPGGGSLGEICCEGACVAQDANNCGGCGTMCDTTSDETCIDVPVSPLGGGICCGMMLPFIGGFCTGGGFGGLDAGLPIP